MTPTRSQLLQLSQHSGTARFVYNWALAEWQKQFKAGLKPTAAKLKKEFNAAKYAMFPWLRNVARDSHSQPFSDLNHAFQRFFKKQGKYPRFKRSGKSIDSFYVANDKLQIAGNRVRLPKIGWVKLREMLRFTGKIMSARVTQASDRWFISVAMEVPDVIKPRIANGEIGIDLGLKAFAVTSDGEIYESPKPLRKSMSRLRRASKNLSRKKNGSKNRKKARKKLAKVHAKIANIRNDFLHKLSTKISRENQTVVLEDLHVRGMLRNRTLSRAVSDAGFGEFRRQLAYKIPWHGGRLVVISRWEPTSKTCSACGEIKESLSLSDRVYRCDCGLVIDRDLNAAINIKTAGLAGLACGLESSDVSHVGGCVKLSRMKQELECTLVRTI